MFKLVKQKMTHNQIIENFKKKIPTGAFFQYWAKSKFAKNPWDVTYIYMNAIHLIEFKKAYDKLRPHQKEGLILAERNSINIYPWVIRGGIERRGELVRNFIRLESLNGRVIREGKYQDIVTYLNQFGENGHESINE